MEEDRTDSAIHLRYIYTQALYGYEEFGKKYISEKAKNVYKSLGLPGKLSQWQGREQRKFESKGKRHGIFHLDHIYTISMFKRALKNQNEQLTAKTINKLVSENYAVAWILSDENKLLDGRGYKANRGETLEDALDVYSKLGIKLIRVV